MKTVSDAFLQSVSGSHMVVVQVVVVDGKTGVQTSLAVLDGAVTLDRTRDIRGTFEATLADATGSLTPSDAESLLAPYGNEITISRGVRLGDGTDELVDLGIYRIDSFSVAEDPNGLVIKISGSDRSAVIQRNRWIDPYVVTSQPTEDAIAAIALDRYPAVTTNLPTIGTTPQTVLDAGSDTDPWKDIRELAKASGFEAFFNGEGQLTAAKPRSPDADPHVTYSEDAAVLLNLSRDVSTAASVYNMVVATGEGTSIDVPVRGIAEDDNPDSPTYVEGPFGRVPLFYTSPLMTTESQAQAAAQSRLDGLLGSSETVSWDQIVNPALEPNDIVRISRERAGLDSVNIAIDSITIPLGADKAMSASGRRKFV